MLSCNICFGLFSSKLRQLRESVNKEWSHLPNPCSFHRFLFLCGSSNTDHLSHLLLYRLTSVWWGTSYFSARYANEHVWTPSKAIWLVLIPDEKEPPWGERSSWDACFLSNIVELYPTMRFVCKNTSNIHNIPGDDGNWSSAFLYLFLNISDDVLSQIKISVMNTNCESQLFLQINLNVLQHEVPVWITADKECQDICGFYLPERVKATQLFLEVFSNTYL